MKSGLTINSKGLKKAFKSIAEVTKCQVLVGVPDSGDSRKVKEGEQPKDFNNAGIGYINENGSPAQNIPARPHLVPGVESVQDKTISYFKKASEAALVGDTEKAIKALESAGIAATNAVKRILRDGELTPLADGTVAARARRGRKGAKAELKRRRGVEAVDSDTTTNVKPLIDTGEYRRSITSVVRKR